MITLHRPSGTTAPIIKVLSIGGAGGNVLDRLVLDGLDCAALIALNTDVLALNGSVAPHKIHLGRATTRGLGAGGDPEVGYEAADEAEEEIRKAIDGADMIFLCAGLGGGTGSGAAPLVAHMARSAGAMVIAFATMPFTFEGKRRRTQAAESLTQLEEQADLVICFENDQMSENLSPAAGIQESFTAADQTLSQAIRSIAAMLQRSGLINVGLDELTSALRRQHPRCIFGYGESDTANRAHEALARALKNPLMGKGRTLADAPSILVHVAGGSELTLNEVTVLMDEFNRHVSDNTRVHFGVATDAKLGQRLCITIITSTGAPIPAAAPAPRPATARQPAAEPAPRTPAQQAPLQHTIAQAEDFPEPLIDTEGEPEQEEELAPQWQPAAEAAPSKYAQPTAHLTRKPPMDRFTTAAAAKKEEKAEQMTLEPVNRGRFEKAQPTIVDGKDLDIPTFLRKNLTVK